MPRPAAKKTSSFRTLLNSFHEDEAIAPSAPEPIEQPEPEPNPVPPPVAIAPPPPAATPGRKRTGKRSNPNYEQVGMYVPVDTMLQVRRQLAGRKDLDLSDLVSQLLADWLATQSDK